jgi:Flp pilus assembly protein TadG
MKDKEGRRPRQPSRRRRGAALIEFAIVLVLLLTIVLGCVDFGRYANTLIVVTNAAREGAFVGATSPPSSMSESRWQQLVRDAVVDEMATVVGFDSSRLAVATGQTIDESTGSSRVRVEVGYPFQTVVPWNGFPGEMTLSRAVEMPVIR